MREPVRDVETGFGGLAAVSTIPVAADAIASLERAAGESYALFAQSSSCGDKTLEFNGKGAITGNVHSNGETKLNGEASIDGDVHSRQTLTKDPTITVSGSTTAGGDTAPDPLAAAGENILNWLPGTTRATALTALGKYHEFIGSTITHADVLANGAGVYYADGAVELKDSAATFNDVTFVIDRSGYTDDPVFKVEKSYQLMHDSDPINNPNKIQVITNAGSECDKQTIHINANDVSWTGALYGPTGFVHLNGKQHRDPRRLDHREHHQDQRRRHRGAR